MEQVSFVWLEITGRCQLACVHCYANSGPGGTQGVMAGHDWRRVINEAARLGARMVQFIGGEPTLHPELPALVDHALEVGVQVEVFSNLVHVTPLLWETFARPGVRLACSYYSDQAAQHAAVTGRAGAYARTRANIVEALRQSILLRVGVVDLGDGQRAGQALAELHALGVAEVGYDRVRGVGRGVGDEPADVAQLCGRCASDVLAVSADGRVWPCVFSRWLPVGDVRAASLPDILAGERLGRVRGELAAQFAVRRWPCVPEMCNPHCGPSCSPACHPSCWPTGAGPCTPRGGCVPNYGR